MKLEAETVYLKGTASIAWAGKDAASKGKVGLKLKPARNVKGKGRISLWKALPTVEKDQLRNHLINWTDPEEMHLKLANIIVNPLYHLWKAVVFGGCSQWLKVDKYDVFLNWAEGRSKILQARQSHFNPWEGVNPWEQIFLEAIFRHFRNKPVIWNSQHGFSEGKSYLNNLWWLDLNRGRTARCKWPWVQPVSNAYHNNLP